MSINAVYGAKHFFEQGMSHMLARSDGNSSISMGITYHEYFADESEGEAAEWFTGRIDGEKGRGV